MVCLLAHAGPRQQVPPSSAIQTQQRGTSVRHLLTAVLAFCPAAAAVLADMRQDWARAWADLIAPGGELVTLIFPIGGNPAGAPQNPPWPVTPELYQELLLPAGMLFASLQLLAGWRVAMGMFIRFAVADS